MIPKEIRVTDLPETSQLHDVDVFLTEDSMTTYKVSGSTVIDYIKSHPDMNNTFIQEMQKGAANGVAPLDTQSKIGGGYLLFGDTSGTVFEGSAGKALNDSLTAHTTDTGNPHQVTKAQIGLGNVENKSSFAIREELTAQNVLNALGYTPEADGAYEQAAAYTDERISQLINGAPEELDTLKEIADAFHDNGDVLEALNEAVTAKADQAELDTHTGNSLIHVTQTDKDHISTALSHAASAHARADATKTAVSDTNGNISINDAEITVYTHPLSGVTPGSYRQITVDANGHVVAGDNTVLPITQGGTGAATTAGALANLGFTATIDELNKLSGATPDTVEINYITGVTGPIQAQLNAKAPAQHGNHVPDINDDTSGKLLYSNGTVSEWKALNSEDIINALGYTPGNSEHVFTAVKGDAEESYQTGYVNITPEGIGLGNVDNTHDNEKAVLSAKRAEAATHDSSGQSITSTYIKDLSCSNGQITYTRGDGSTGNCAIPGSIVEVISQEEPADQPVNSYWLVPTDHSEEDLL